MHYLHATHTDKNRLVDGAGGVSFTNEVIFDHANMGFCRLN
jgi:hypothetical protein